MPAPRRVYNPRRTLTALVVLIAMVLWPHAREWVGSRPRDYDLAGATMGTTYSVKVRDARVSSREMRRHHAEINAILESINRQMSTYDVASDISRFNRQTNLTPFAVAPAMVSVTALALDLAAQTGGALDPTVLPLVERWGFGARMRAADPPTPAEIAAAREQVGYGHIEIVGDAALRKRHPAVRLDLNAVAKGYAADRVAEYLRGQGCPHVFVEIGGEIMAFGESAPATPWRVGIERPVYGAAVGATEWRRVALTDRAVATSGDYRHFFVTNGMTYAHVIDPTTGYPVSNGVASVSVLAPTCALADGAATALMVMGPERGLAWLETLEGVEALIVTRQADGTYVEAASEGFPPP